HHVTDLDERRLTRARRGIEVAEQGSGYVDFARARSSRFLAERGRGGVFAFTRSARPELVERLLLCARRPTASIAPDAQLEIPDLKIERGEAAFVEQFGDLGDVFRRQAHFLPPKMAITWRSGLSSGGLTGAAASFADHTV